MPNTQPRILIVITTLTFGGAESQVVRLASELKRAGWRVAIACLIKPKTYLEQLEKDDVEVHSLDMPRGLPDPRAIWRLCRLVRSFRPDIVHSHMVHANLLARVARLFCHMPGLISTAHNLRETSEKGGPTWHKEKLYRWTDFLADRTTIICQAAFDRYVAVGAVPRHKLEVIPNGIDVTQFCPTPEARRASRLALGLPESSFVWLAVGRLVEQKDYFTLLQAVHALPDSDFRVLVAGNGSLMESLKAESSRLGLDKRVAFLGASEDIRHLYAAADAFVMSSIFEGLSAALLEAAAMRLPAVVTDAGGNTEIVTHGESGYVVPARQPARLADAMQNLMQLAPAVRQSFGERARQRCLDRYRFEIVTAQWLDLYARCSSRIMTRPDAPSEVQPGGVLDSVANR